MTKNQIIIEHVVVTFFEAAVAYLAINQTNLSGNAKLSAIGALGAGLSAVYNVLRQSNPTLPPKPEALLNGIVQISPPVEPTIITPTVEPQVVEEPKV